MGEALERARANRFEPPPDPDTPLARICHQAMATDPWDRYANAGEFAEAVSHATRGGTEPP